jgi:myo-inositol-1-phosphate synthase
VGFPSGFASIKYGNIVTTFLPLPGQRLVWNFPAMNKIRIAIVGVGNCASSLLQGINFYRDSSGNGADVGLMHRQIGPYQPQDIEVVAAFDIDRRKVGLDAAEAIFSPPNCTKVFCEKIKPTGTIVMMGCVFDGYAAHMRDYDANRTFLPLEKESTREQIIEELRKSGAEIMVNYLPVGSEEATRFYAACALEANLAFVNNIPVFIASDPVWAKRFADKNLPLVGDDIKSQMGATVLHRTIVDLFRKRGVKVERTYQLNTGGNTDFLNMLSRSRLASKKTSKTEAVQSVIGERLADDNIHIGPSDYVPWQCDNKICFIRVEGKLFGDVPMELDVKLSVEDSPNSAGVAIDAIRCCKLALDRGKGGVLHSASAYFSKHPPVQITDDEAHRCVEEFISGARDS